MSKLYMANCHAREAAGAKNAISGRTYDKDALSQVLDCETYITVHYGYGDVYFEVPDDVPFLANCMPVLDKEFTTEFLADTDHVVEVKEARRK